jgi:hypothetical protein
MTKKCQESKMEEIKPKAEATKTGLSSFGFWIVQFSQNRWGLIRVGDLVC